MTMTTTTLTANTTSALWTSLLSTLTASFIEFCAGARECREIEARYLTLTRKSNADLATIRAHPFRHHARRPVRAAHLSI
jgi:hypothetical protein